MAVVELGWVRSCQNIGRSGMIGALAFRLRHGGQSTMAMGETEPGPYPE